MYKRTITTLLTALMVGSAFAIPDSAAQAASDSARITAAETIAASAHPDHNGVITRVDGEAYLLQDGRAYLVEDVSETFSEMKREAQRKVDAERHSGAWKNENAVVLMMIIFIVPCVTLIVIAMMLLMFFKNKNTERNELISKAIDHNYPLPDSFYSGIAAVFSSSQTDGSSVNTAENSGKVLPPQSRDPRKYTSGSTLIAIGIGMIVFFLCVGAEAPAAMGTIPLLIGIGRILGYYFVPGSSNDGRHNRYDRGGYYGGGNNSCPPPPPGPRYPDDEGYPRR